MHLGTLVYWHMLQEQDNVIRVLHYGEVLCIWGIEGLSKCRLAALFSRTCKSLAAITKSNGERGYLCLTPFTFETFYGTQVKMIDEEPKCRISCMKF